MYIPCLHSFTHFTPTGVPLNPDTYARSLSLQQSEIVRPCFVLDKTFVFIFDLGGGGEKVFSKDFIHV